ncbi:tRNA uridine-5-carboxymethylaminomethyl(34) synthesis GTPase MnmE [Candidatus Viridilinea mediisalina]|uniref:tRNA modification GTPase MnmE n=1 Tax=Candidatus Viridilinea mediisalina TaxID=2024553 RepID=A0A2A6RG72_9CHLR|nr:tRNA uridine-5-carboxymethylaminomethyl(34) synthesis GTPase MnmE [Candidatus Viridilinea mediisalina]PDW01860.1 tRNA uridine-5-carboxymethylaminomethyl(34) synthesis GTPase MnmE [Candidatus Viridilinea mediisalina]
MYQDTIVAIATPPGEGGIAVVRLSGADALAVVTQFFRPLRPEPLRSFRLRYGQIVDPATQQVVDEVLVALMRAPRSFTREDVVEISLHGGTLPVQTTLRLCLGAGARLARPGEFTLRAFLNGRIDLSQAEATLDVIRAQTDAALALAQAQLGGWLAQEVRAVRSALLNALAYVTVLVDFPEDEVEPQTIGPELEAGLATVNRLLASADQGLLYRQGARLALVGRPNVGKSSLLNALLRSERAIVTPIPGTTRDTLEESANLAGIPVVLTDTAGIHASPDPVERLGIERTHAALAQADLALFVLDATTPPGHDDYTIAELIGNKPCIVVWNKVDLNNAVVPKATPELPNCRAAPCMVSAHTGHGMEQLVQTIAQQLLGGSPLAAGAAQLVSNPRHQDALRRAHEHLSAALAGHNANHPTDLLAGDLTAALNALGEITGETVGEDLLDVIFSRFCIGK